MSCHAWQGRADGAAHRGGAKRDGPGGGGRMPCVLDGDPGRLPELRAPHLQVTWRACRAQLAVHDLPWSLDFRTSVGFPAVPLSLQGMQRAPVGLPRMPHPHHLPNPGLCLSGCSRIHLHSIFLACISNVCDCSCEHQQKWQHDTASYAPFPPPLAAAAASPAPLPLPLVVSWKELPTATSSVSTCSPAGWSCMKCTRQSRWCWSRDSR